MRCSIPLAFAAALLAGPALAAATPPAKPVAAGFYSGQWFEIARTPNAGQRDCHAASTRFTSRGPAAFSVAQVCHRGAGSGPAKTFSTSGKILAGSGNARFSMSFLGGLKVQEYWVLDRADDQAWAIMATPGGHFVWLLSRRPTLPSATLSLALARVKALGYARLEFPQQTPA